MATDKLLLLLLLYDDDVAAQPALMLLTLMMLMRGCVAAAGAAEWLLRYLDISCLGLMCGVHDLVASTRYNTARSC